jgi:hypothetical protein
VTIAINVIVNAAISWFGVRGQETVTMWGPPLVETTIFWNLVGTLFLLPLITCVLTTTAVRRDVRRDTLTPLDRLRATCRWLRALPRPRGRRGLMLGAAVTALLGPPLTLILALAGFPDLTRDQFIASQTAFAVVLGIFVTAPIALFAMADPHPDTAPGLRQDPAL